MGSTANRQKSDLPEPGATTLRVPHARDRSGNGHTSTTHTTPVPGPQQHFPYPQHPAHYAASPGPVASNAPAPQKTLARVARRSRKHLEDVTDHAQSQLLKQLHASGRLQTFVDHGSKFRDEVFAKLPELSKKLIDFLTATPTYHFTASGVPKLVLPDGVAMTAEQLRLLQSVLDKFVPQQKPMDLDGKQTQPVRKVSIHVATVGQAPDYEKLPGGSDGIANQGAAKPVTTITFDKPGASPRVSKDTDGPAAGPDGPVT